MGRGWRGSVVGSIQPVVAAPFGPFDLLRDGEDGGGRTRNQLVRYPGHILFDDNWERTNDCRNRNM